MKTFVLKNQIESILQERRILTMVETINAIDPTVNVHSFRIKSKSEYDCIQWEDLADKARFPFHLIEEEQLKRTKDLWLILLMEEANLLQQKALSLHTISQENPLHQKALYDQKYEAAVEYVSDVHNWQAQNNTTDLPTEEQCQSPPIIFEEGDRTGDPLYYLSLAIIENYRVSQKTLKRFYGQVEGERRVTKKRILQCNTVEDLKNVAWANWPNYEGDPPNPAD